MNVNDKIKQIMIDKSLSPSVFADEIGVQRSSISHILSGRNRPSLDIIQKVIRRYPDLGYDWIMEDDPSEIPALTKPAATIRPTRETNPISTTRNTLAATRPVVPATINVSIAEGVLNSESAVASTAKEKTVERILIFYKDGTFREYTPAATGAN